MSNTFSASLEIYLSLSFTPIRYDIALYLLTPFLMRACVVLDKCDFEDGLCDMEQVNWRVWSGSTPTKNTGPDYDHTTFLPEGWFERC